MNKDQQLIFEAYLKEMRGYALDDLKIEMQHIEDQHPRAQVTYLKGIVEDLLERKTANVLQIREVLEAGNIRPEAIKALLDFEGPYLGQGR